ncbi:MAG: hypothetical protein ACLFST_10090 [Spirochaetia bacterium]
MKKYLLISVLSLLITAGITFADSLADRIDRKIPAAYAGIEDELLTLLETADRTGVPESLLVSLIREGVAKSVRSGVLLDVIQREYDSYRYIAVLAEQEGFRGENPENYDEFLKSLNIYRKMGLSAELLEYALKAGPDRKSVLYALEAVTKILKTGDLELSVYYDLLKSLFDSQLPPKYYPSLGNVFLKARNSGLNSGQTAEIVINTLNSGGGIIQINRRIEERSPRR